jgi:PAS domain S-box-containing protein
MRSSPSAPGRGLAAEYWIPAVYAVASGLWIAVSDDALALLVRHPQDITYWSTAKGWGFVALTAVLLHLGLRRVLATRRAAARQLERVERRAQALVESSPDGILILVGVEIAYANAAAARLVGAARPADLVGRPVLDFLDPSQHASVRERASDVQAGRPFPPVQVRTVRRADGTTFRAEVLAAPLEHDGERAVQITVRDVTDALRLEQGVRRANAALRTLGAVNEALVRAASEAELMSEVCRIAVELGGYAAAWVGVAERDPARSIRLVASHGVDAQTVGGLGLSWGDGGRPHGLAATAIRTGRPCVVNDLWGDQRAAPFAAFCRAAGYRAGVAIPMSSDGERVGVFDLFAAEPGAFDEAVVPLLQQLVDDLSFGLAALRTRAALATEREFLGAILENAGVLVGVVDREGTLVRANPELERLSGWPLWELEGRPIWERLLSPDEAAVVRQSLPAVWKGDFPVVFVNHLLTRGGDRREIEWTQTALRGADGEPTFLLGIGQDVTDRRRAEERLHESREQLRALAGRLQSVREEEKGRLARDLHDELGQLLTGLKMELRWLERRLGELPSTDAINGLLDRAVGASELVDQTVASVQRLAAELRPGALDRLGLVPALRQEVRRFLERTAIPCEARLDEGTPEPPPEVATALYRICQEALTNVSRHAGASHVVVALAAEPGALRLQVWDDGSGIDEVALRPEALGLLGMTERATLLGGEATIQRRPEGGTLVSVRLPTGTATGGAG